MKLVLQRLAGKLRLLYGDLTCPSGLTRSDGLRYWQERTIGIVAFLGVVLGPVAYAPSFALSLIERRYGVALLDTLVLLGVVGLFVFRRVSYKLRSFVFIGFSYLVGAVLFYVLGPFGAGPVWLFTPPILAGILMGRRWAFLGVLTNVGILIGVGIYLHFNVGAQVAYPLSRWLVISANFVLLNAIAALGAAQVVTGLENSLKEEQHARAELDRQHHALEAAHKELARESEERKKAAEALQVSEERFRRAFESIPDIVVIYNTDFEIQHMNKAAREFGGRASSASGDEPEGPGCSAELHQVHLTMLRVVSRTKDVCQFETNLQLPKDGVRNLRITCVPLAKENGDIHELLCLTHDFTEQAGLEARFRQAQKLEAVGTLAGGIAHDFNNVLGAIMGYSHLVSRALPEDSPARGDMNQVISAAERAANLVKQILTFSRRTEQERHPVELQLIVKEVLKLVRPSLPSTIQILKDIDDTCMPIMADPTQMHQVLMNLCTNAYHAMREAGGALAIVLEPFEVDADFVEQHQELREGLYVSLTVSDTGHGMTREVRERIFEPFFTTKGKGEGTGLGLATVHGIVASHGGSILVYSEPGQGTAFHVYLPCVNQAAPQKSSRSERVLGGTERLLVVDDEPDLALLMERVLQRHGYSVTVAAGSSQALQLFESQPEAYDLVVTDFTMPTMTGLELARSLVRIRPGFPVILMSGIEVPTRDADGETPIRLFLRKPASPDELARAVREVLDGDEAEAS